MFVILIDIEAKRVPNRCCCASSETSACAKFDGTHAILAIGYFCTVGKPVS